MIRVNTEQFRSDLRGSIALLSSLCLYQAAKWSGEALLALPPPETDFPAPQPYLPQGNNTNDDMINQKENDQLLLAKIYFDCKEFDRAAFLLKNCVGTRATFLRLYSKYIAGEKKKEEESDGVLGSTSGSASNQNLLPIMRDIDAYMKKTNTPDPFISYLAGIIYSRQNNENEAIKMLVHSITMYPYNWGAWKQLLSCYGSFDNLTALMTDLPSNIMTSMFMLVANQEFFKADDKVFELLSELEGVFQQFNFLTIQRALINYHSLEYLESEKLFDQVLKTDPCCLDDLDTYSNILYVQDKQAKLSFLAHLSLSIDRFRSETCCIVANYYSLKAEHEKAIIYYRRALSLNRDCLSAWTLMGHEFVELKNSCAAIESYRRAVDTNKKDFRAWYGLGQAYEVLDMNYYSLYYYQKAASLKPLDTRMWQAIGNSYEKLSNLDDSVKSYRRALTLSPTDPILLYKLGQLYDRVKDHYNAFQYMSMCLAEEEAECVTDETSKARIWLARYQVRRGDWAKASELVDQMTMGSKSDLEEAKSIGREAKMRLRSGNLSGK